MGQRRRRGLVTSKRAEQRCGRRWSGGPWDHGFDRSSGRGCARPGTRRSGGCGPGVGLPPRSALAWARVSPACSSPLVILVQHDARVDGHPARHRRQPRAEACSAAPCRRPPRGAKGLPRYPAARSSRKLAPPTCHALRGRLGRTLAEAVGRASSVEAHTPPVAALPQPALARRSRRQTHLVPTLLPARADESQGQGPKLALAERKILAALAQYPQGRTKTQVALLAGYAQSGGGFNNAVGALRSRGWISDRRSA
jgi:hypothetical protein